MSEIKTIKGKVEFKVAPYTNFELDVWNYLTDNDPINGIKLSEVTEQQAESLVERFYWDGSFRDYSHEPKEAIKGGIATAKESLFSLLKVNGCETKDTKVSPHKMDYDYRQKFSSKQEAIDDYNATPDDYLLIMKQ